MRRKSGHILSTETNAAIGCFHDTGDQVKQAGLARAIGPDNRTHFSGLDPHRHMIDRHDTAIPLGQSVEFKQCHQAALRPRRD